MHDARINTVYIWFSTVIQDGVELVDGNGDYTGEYGTLYAKPVKVRANLSPAHGSAEDEVFGLSVNYTKVLTTAKMNIGITIDSLVWDEEPSVDDDFYIVQDDENALINDSVYRVVRIGKGHYHLRFALKKLHGDDE